MIHTMPGQAWQVTKTVCRKSWNPDEPFQIFFKSSEIGEFHVVVQERRATDFKATKLRKPDRPFPNLEPQNLEID